MQLLPLLLAILAFAGPAWGQSKEDVIACIEAVLSLPEAAPVFQTDLYGRKSVVIRQNDGSAIRPQEEYRLLGLMNEEDFRDFPLPVRVMRENEMQSAGVPWDESLSVGMQYEEGKMNVLLQTRLNDDRRQGFYGMFQLEQSDGEWQVAKKSVRIGR